MHNRAINDEKTKPKYFSLQLVLMVEFCKKTKNNVLLFSEMLTTISREMQIGKPLGNSQKENSHSYSIDISRFSLSIYLKNLQV